MYHIQRVIFCLALIAIVSSTALAVAGERPLVLAYFESPFQSLHVTILTEAYERIGLSVKFEKLPAKRALLLSGKGVVDGETNRIEKIKDLYPTLIQVPVPLHPLIGAAYTKGRELNISSWEDMKPYRIGVLLGVPFYEKPTEGMNRTYAYDYEQLFRMLVQKRVDVVIGTTYSSERTINRNFPDEGISRAGGDLIFFNTFHYLHEKNKDLVPLIQKSLQKMKDSGRIDEVVQENKR